MNYQRLKEIVSRNYPVTFIWQKATALRTGNGRFRRRIPRQVGYSQDRRLSIEALGSKGQLDELRCMISLDDVALSAVSLRAVVTCIREVMPEYDDAWLVQAVRDVKGTDVGRVSIHFEDLGEVRIAFVNVRLA